MDIYSCLITSVITCLGIGAWIETNKPTWLEVGERKCIPGEPKGKNIHSLYTISTIWVKEDWECPKKKMFSREAPMTKMANPYIHPISRGMATYIHILGGKEGADTHLYPL